ncbi:Uma2 family endonuclease [Streptomyces sp. CAI-85]|uniref:Uma2 family endonuclease n=1 Tax=Streptomyces sp. CAI-85 TaxID=1472662 RepID=UPI00158769AD|nr:Uma2 family endonuclease [Streptomyces sp. CAI-85]NUV62052.1 Uma2 family endonuclease [Streptomyces sp. CAI-85]
MSALTVDHDPGQGWDDLVRLWDEMEWPEGSKAEIVEGVVTTSPVPAYRHHVIVERIQRRLYSVIPEAWEIFQRQAVAVPSCLGMFIPDLLVVPARVCAEAGNYIPAGAAELVVEVTSMKNARHDRVAKPAAYASAGIPLYILVDRWSPEGPTATLFGEPQGDVYRPLVVAKFGEPLALPAPFDVTIDTAEFPAD